MGSVNVNKAKESAKKAKDKVVQAATLRQKKKENKEMFDKYATGESGEGEKKTEEKAEGEEKTEEKAEGEEKVEEKVKEKVKTLTRDNIKELVKAVYEFEISEEGLDKLNKALGDGIAFDKFPRFRSMVAIIRSEHKSR